MTHQRELNVSCNRHRAEGGCELKCAAAPKPPELATGKAGDVAIVEAHLSGIWSELSVDDVEAGRLAGAIGADQGQELACAEIEADIVEGAHTAECLRQIAYREDAHAAFLRASRAFASVPTTPPGKTKTRMSITSPRSPRQKAVSRMIVSCSSGKTVAPTIGPESVWMPPSSTITMATMER